MKTIKNTILAIVAVLGFTQMTQAQKVVHVNYLEIVDALPETKKSTADIQKIGEEYATDLRKKEIDLQAKSEKFQLESKSRTQAENEKVYIALQQEAANLQQAKLAARQDIQKREQDALIPIRKKIDDAIKAYAQEKGIQYVYDRGTLVYAGGKDITSEIKAKLGAQ